MRPVLLLALASLAVPAVALAAPKAGSYSGSSSGKYVQIGMATEPTDKGKVTFKVSGSKVTDFKLRGQLVQCGPPAEIPLNVKSIKLSAKGSGSATVQAAGVGALKVSITVGSTGKASGTIARPRSAAGLCDPAYPVRFTAKRG